MGLFFITFFNVIGYTAKTVGVNIATVSNKLSLVIPFILSVLILKAPFNIWNILGCIAAIGAVILTCFKKNTIATNQKNNYFLPFILFLGSGALDFLIKYTTTKFVDPKLNYLFFIVGFATAFCVGFLYLIYQLINSKTTLALKNVWMGIAIGIPNYFSFYYLVKFINSGAMPEATAIPINNISIVIGSALLAWWLIKEKLSLINILGIALAVAAIGLLSI
jgi:drug/metabolite transporter (DMT)-like permease